MNELQRILGVTDAPARTMSCPRSVHEYVRKLCQLIVPGAEPVRVPVAPASGAEIDECFLNVPQVASKAGGSLQHGWCIWEVPGIFVEGEFHGVWRTPEGKLVDVTPKRDRQEEILFLADPTETFDEHSPTRRDNVRLAILDHPVVREFIRHCEEFHRFKEAGTHPTNPRLFSVDADRYEWYVAKKEELMRRLDTLPIGRNDICRCGSGKKFKKCCGRVG